VKKVKKDQSKKTISRRAFLKTSTLVATGAAIGLGAVSVPLLKSKDILLRPPGALNEDLFLASCIKCGQCLQVCPPQILKLANISQGFGIGTPYLVPREGACILCSGLPCVLACPTGALDHHLSLGKDAQMGLAVLSGPESCLSPQGINDLIFRLKNYQKNSSSLNNSSELEELLLSLFKRLNGDEKKTFSTRFSLPELSDAVGADLAGKLKGEDLDWLVKFVELSSQAQTPCQICLDECPIKEEQPIQFIAKEGKDNDRSIVLPVVTETCVGCGVCEEKCPTPKASITIVPRLRPEKRSMATRKPEEQS